jgi:hypothetical protein
LLLGPGVVLETAYRDGWASPSGPNGNAHCRVDAKAASAQAALVKNWNISK